MHIVALSHIRPSPNIRGNRPAPRKAEPSSRDKRPAAGRAGAAAPSRGARNDDRRDDRRVDRAGRVHGGGGGGRDAGGKDKAGAKPSKGVSLLETSVDLFATWMVERCVCSLDCEGVYYISLHR